MVQTLILTRANIKPNSGNSTFLYSFPQTVHFQNDFVAVQQVSLYNSVYNITSAFGNNKFSYTWVDGTVVNVNFPDGSYTIFAINTFLQSVMVSNKHYTTDTNGLTNLYYLEIIPNVVTYSYQINCYPVNTTNAGAYTVVPAGATWTLANCNTSAGGAITPTITIPATNIQTLLGFTSGTYPNCVITPSVTPYVQTPTQTTTYSILSQNAPQINPQPSYLGLCSLVNNPKIIPSQLIYIISPDGNFGNLYTNQINNLAFNKIADGNYKDFEFRFVDSAGNPIQFQDPAITILLVIKNIAEDV
jgi:hypothetical protein